MKKIFLIILVLWVLAINGCIGTELKFETVSKDDGLIREDIVINSKEEFIDATSQAPGHFRDQEVLEKGNLILKSIEEKSGIQIDFSKDTLIGVSQGGKTTGGYSIEITRIIEKSDKIVVYIKEKEPSKNGGVTLAFTHPIHLVKIKKITKEVVFKR